MFNAQEYMELMSAQARADNEVPRNTLAYIDDDFDPMKYPQILPKVRFNGQPVSLKGYKVTIPGYVPMPGDRVLMIPVGNDWVIGGVLETQREVLFPGTTVWEASYDASQTLNATTDTTINWQIVDLDLVGSEQNRGAISRFQPSVPGWYSVGGSIMFADATSSYRGAWIAYNGTANNYNFVQISASNNVGHGLAVPPKVLYFNGTSDYAVIRGRQNSGGTLSLTTGSRGAGNFYAVYQGHNLPEEANA